MQKPLNIQYNKLGVALFAAVLGVFVSAYKVSADEQVFIERDMFVLDLVQNIEWLRCSLGQVWDGNTCKGEIMKLNHDEIEQAVLQANEQLGEGWRLPTSDELKILFAKPVHRQKSTSHCFRPHQPSRIGLAKPTRIANQTYIQLIFIPATDTEISFPISAWRYASCATANPPLLRFHGPRGATARF